MKDVDLIKYEFSAIVKYLEGDFEEFRKYKRMAVKAYEQLKAEEEGRLGLVIPIGEYLEHKRKRWINDSRRGCKAARNN